MGTTSTLLFERPRDVLSSNFDDWPFLSVHFWGEKADGRWTLQIINAGNRHVNSPGKIFLVFISPLILYIIVYFVIIVLLYKSTCVRVVSGKSNICF